jgi:thioredoxin reductase
MEIGMNLQYEVIVVGSGSAGQEACLMAAKAGLRTLLTDDNQANAKLFTRSGISKTCNILIFAPVKAARPAAYFIVSFECGEKSTGTRSEPKANKQPFSFATNESSAVVEILEDESCKFGVLIQDLSHKGAKRSLETVGHSSKQAR